MDIQLTPHFKEYIEQKVASGQYTDESDVIRAALRMLEDYDQEREAKLRDLRQAIEEGINSGPSEPLDMEEIKRTARARWEQKHLIVTIP